MPTTTMTSTPRPTAPAVSSERSSASFMSPPDAPMSYGTLQYSVAGRGALSWRGPVAIGRRGPAQEQCRRDVAGGQRLHRLRDDDQGVRARLRGQVPRDLC